MKTDEMTKQDLIDYMNTVLELEIELRVINNCLEEINQHCENLGVENDIPEPVLYEEEVPTKVDAIGVFSIWFVGSLLLMCLIPRLGILIIGTATGLIASANKLLSIPRIKQSNEDYARQYEIDVKKYNKACEREEERMYRETKELDIYDQQFDILDNTYDNTLEILEKLYDKGIIYSKYRDFVSIGMFCEYLESGRCDRLDGPNGAYNIYENEIRQDIIISRLEDIIQCLDEIKETQFKLYCEVQNMNCKIDELVQSVHEVAQNQLTIIDNQNEQIEQTKIVAYNTEILKYNSNIAVKYML